MDSTTASSPPIHFTIDLSRESSIVAAAWNTKDVVIQRRDRCRSQINSGNDEISLWTLTVAVPELFPT